MEHVDDVAGQEEEVQVDQEALDREAVDDLLELLPDLPADESLWPAPDVLLSDGSTIG